MNKQMEGIYTKLTSKTITEAKLTFQKLEIKNTATAEGYFGTYGIRNMGDRLDLPYERLACYEYLLQTLKSIDSKKYNQIHKGTPFLLLSWFALDIENYEKSLFYMDSAINEDVRAGGNWQELPMGKVLTLSLSDNPIPRATKEIRSELEETLTVFNKETKSSLSIDDLINKFVISLINKDKKYHSIVTALYSFILEKQGIHKLLDLRGSDGGSIEPVLTYLFKGGLIFESLLKYLYPEDDNREINITLGSIFNTTSFRDDFIGTVARSSNTLRDILDAIKNSDLQTAFDTTSKLRNTSGHNLVWDDIFNNPNNFEKLQQQEINAILFIIQKKFLNN